MINREVQGGRSVSLISSCVISLIDTKYWAAAMFAGTETDVSIETKQHLFHDLIDRNG